ncbi:MAG: HD domain-containing protein [Burkholderiales bacterium]|nr:HD domain-containing protein [Burkholderiales bacterium]
MKASHVVRFLTDALDLVGVTDQGHDKRVGIVAHALAGRLGLPPATRDRIFVAGLLHDVGVSSTHAHDHLVADDQWGEVDRHCDRGARLLASLDGFAALMSIVRNHHRPWSSPEMAALPREGRVEANLVFLADRLDAWVSHGLGARAGALAKARASLGTLFSPSFAPALDSIAQGADFWADMGRERLSRRVDGILHAIAFEPLSARDLATLPYLMAAIVDAKCPYTAEHSFRVAAIARRMGEAHDLPGAECEQLQTAGLLHDIGKLAIPDEIVNKRGPLDADERRVMEEHARHSYEVIVRLPGLERIAELARHHHEREDGRGYPDGIGGTTLPLAARILGVADVFQALTQRRPYRPGKDEAEVRRTLADARRSGWLDATALDALDARFDEYWALSTGPLALRGLDPGLARLCLNGAPDDQAATTTSSAPRTPLPALSSRIVTSPASRPRLR